MKHPWSAAAVITGFATISSAAAAQSNEGFSGGASICHMAAERGVGSVSRLAPMMGFSRSADANGREVWTNDAASQRVVVVAMTTPGPCVVSLTLKQGGAPSDVVEAWAAENGVALAAVPNGDRVGQSGGFSYRYRQPANDVAALVVTPAS